MCTATQEEEGATGLLRAAMHEEEGAAGLLHAAMHKEEGAAGPLRTTATHEELGLLLSSGELLLEAANQAFKLYHGRRNLTMRNDAVSARVHLGVPPVRHLATPQRSHFHPVNDNEVPS